MLLTSGIYKPTIMPTRILKKKFTKFVPRVRSSQGRNGSHYKLMAGKLYPFRSIVRFGSTSKVRDLERRVEVNTVQAIRNSSDKLKMKQIFKEAGIRSPKYVKASECANPVGLPSGWKFPVVAKMSFRSGGKGMVKIDNQEQLTNFLHDKVVGRSRDISNPYYLEEFVNCKREYRIHVSQITDAELFAVRKLIDEETPKEKQWIRSIANGLFKEEFEKPQHWSQMVAECKKALKAVGLDIGCFDVKYNKTRGEFWLLEVNSSPALGEKTKAHYITEIDKILKHKAR